MPYLDPWGDGFNLVSHIEAINLMPNKYDKLTRMGLFRPVPVSTDAFPLEVKKNQMSLVPVSPRGSAKYSGARGSRFLNYVDIPSTVVVDEVLAADIVAKRRFGSVDQFEGFPEALAEKQQLVKDSIDQTMEYRQLSALKGKVLDADATSVIFDPYELFKMTRVTFDFDLVDSSGNVVAATDVAQKCRNLKRFFKKRAFGERIGEPLILCSPSFFDALKSHPNVEKFYLNYQAAQNLINGGSGEEIFRFEGVTFEVYDADVPSYPDGRMVSFFDEYEGAGLPLGTVNTFVTGIAPAHTKQFVNTLGVPYYSWSREKDWDEGTEFKVESNQLPILLRPQLSVGVNAVKQ